MKPLSARGPPSLLSIDAPRSSVPSINSIYDKRAAAYRQRMMTLTAIPPVAPSSSSARSRTRPRAATSNDSWLNAGPSQRRSGESSTEVDIDRHPNISGPMPVVSSLIPDHPRKPTSIRSSTTHTTRTQASFNQFGVQSKSRSISPIPSRLTSRSQPHSPRTAPAPIADVITTRFQGIPSSAVSPHISIFSSHYSGHPRDGGDSDDEEQEQRNYMLIENDWRGGHIVGPDLELAKKSGKWGHFKGAIGQFGRRKGDLA